MESPIEKTDTTSTADRAPGRPRDESRTRAILDAAYNMLATRELTKITSTKLAQAAGVSTATLYRWWPSKEAILMDAYLAAVEDRVRRRRSGTRPPRSPIAQLRTQLKSSAAAFAGKEGAIVLSLVSCARQSPAVHKLFLERLIQPRRKQDRELIERCKKAGELRASVDADLLLDAVYGPLYFRLLIGHAPLSTRHAERHLTLILDGARPTK